MMNENNLLNSVRKPYSFDRSGSGLITAEGVVAPCVWSCDQRLDGEIKVRCKLAPGDLEKLLTSTRSVDDSPYWGLMSRALKFEGQATDGGSLHLKNVDFALFPDEDEVVFHVAQAVWESGKVEPVSHLVFQLVNYRIVAVPSSSAMLPSGQSIEGTLIPLQLPSGCAWLRAVDGSYNIIKKLEAEGGVEVTAELILPLADSEEEGVEAAQKMCCVLTLLSGNRINWLNYSVIATDGSILSTTAQNAITRSYQRTDLLNLLSDRNVTDQISGTGYAPIINRMMERFDSEEHKWNLTRIINSFHEAISSNHFTEQQGQLLANCMEMLRQSFLQHSGDEFFLPVTDWEAKQKALLKAIKKALKEHFPEQDDWTTDQREEHSKNLSLMSTHAKGFNRYGFKHILGQMADNLGLFSQSVYESLRPAPDPRGFLAPLHLDVVAQELAAATSDWAIQDRKNSIIAFGNMRDQLIHQGRFSPPPADKEIEWTDQEQAERDFKQERFMERFVAAYLCAILGWHQPLPTPPSI